MPKIQWAEILVDYEPAPLQADIQTGMRRGAEDFQFSGRKASSDKALVRSPWAMMRSVSASRMSATIHSGNPFQEKSLTKRSLTCINVNIVAINPSKK